MRCVPLCVMTGVGFSLGLLCSLLLQLPAHNLPANADHSLSADPSFRSRRSFSAGGNVVQNDPENKLPSHRAGQGGSQSTGGKAFQSVPNPQIVSNPFVSGEGADNRRGPANQLTARSSAHRASGAEERESGVKREERAKNGDEGYANTRSPSPFLSPQASANRPVKSFTLRLKNTGEKFVVDSAVKRHVEDEPEAEFLPETDHVSDNKKHSSPSSKQYTNLSDIVTGALWSRQMEDSCPKGFEPHEVSSWRRTATRLQVVRVEEGCGRMQNRLVTFTDGSQACARYRFNTDQIQGEVYSYYLAHLLNITRLPPALLVPVDTLSPQWRGVHLELSMAQWADGRLVVLNRWLDHLTPAYIPEELRHEDRKLHPTNTVLAGKTLPQLCDLLQWSDLIVFDYLTANLDRLVNNMFNQQWNTEMMNNPAHNLERTKGGSLVFLDNESGLFHGYRLLEKYHHYHETLLTSLCVFTNSTARAVKRLHRSGNVEEELRRVFVEGEEVNHKLLPPIPEKNLSVLKDRLARVHDQIVKCEGMYGGR
ncbi:hypothetical protein ACOMHN_059740 [Nucella lapillus]